MNKKNVLVMVLAMLLVCVMSVGGTVAWLSADTDPVVNTFTPSDINITLIETKPELEDGKREAEMVPGNTIDKDPTVSVLPDSEACWLFVKIEKDGGDVTVGTDTYDFDDFITYTVDSSKWMQLTTTDGSLVYYREVPAVAEGETAVSYNVLVDDEVTVKETVTLAMMKALRTTPAEYPTLTFTAYAVQRANIDNVNDAWTQASTSAYTDHVNTTNGYVPATN